MNKNMALNAVALSPIYAGGGITAATGFTTGRTDDRRRFRCTNRLRGSLT
ncbi:hypothetical protein [Zhihengliuella sp.]|nr:hypothetical protein [Zhihengliuella sp.]